jgi:hypothetical protein
MLRSCESHYSNPAGESSTCDRRMKLDLFSRDENFFPVFFPRLRIMPMIDLDSATTADGLKQFLPLIVHQVTAVKTIFL